LGKPKAAGLQQFAKMIAFLRYLAVDDKPVHFTSNASAHKLGEGRRLPGPSANPKSAFGVSWTSLCAMACCGNSSIGWGCGQVILNGMSDLAGESGWRFTKP
jgi:hypothetical protein